MSDIIKKLLVIAAVIAISVVFVVQFRPGSDADPKAGPDCAVKVSDHCVPYTDYLATLRLMAPRADEEILAQLRLRETIINGLVERWLLNQEAERLGVSVSENELTKQLGQGIARFSLPAAQMESTMLTLRYMMRAQLLPPPDGPGRVMPVLGADQKFDYKRYQKWVQTTAQKTLTDFREFQRSEAVAARMRELIASRVMVSENEAFAKYAKNQERVVAEFVRFERAYYQTHVLDQSRKAVKKWAEDNSKEVDESWEQSKDRYGDACRATSQIFIRIDDTNPDKAAATATAKTTIDAVKERLDKGEAFADLARELSDDPVSKKHGGKLGCIAPGKLAAPNTSKPVDDALSTMEKGVSAPIVTGAGFHILKVDKIFKGGDAAKEGRYETARDLYLKMESEKLASTAAVQVNAAIKSGKTLAEALTTHLDSVLPEDALEIVKKGRAGETVEGNNAWSDATRPQVRTSDPFPRGGPPFGQAKNPMGAAGKIFELTKVGSSPESVIALYDGYAVATLKERKDVTKEKWDEERDAFIDRMRREKQRDALVEYVQELRRKHGEIQIYVKLTKPKPPAAPPGGKGLTPGGSPLKLPRPPKKPTGPAPAPAPAPETP